MNQQEVGKAALSDEQLAQSIPGFSSSHAQVNGIDIHYVSGGQGDPLVLLPGWPETWWAFHELMPLLSASYRVIAVDIRGMGSSGKPAAGFDKKTMAADIYELLAHLGHRKAHILGHDIGAGVAYSFAAIYPAATMKLILLDTPPIDKMIYKLPMLPAMGGIKDRVGEDGAVYPWWVAFNQVKGLPEDLLLNKGRILVDWLCNYLSEDPGKLPEQSRNVYAQAYDNREGIRAMNAWYQAFPQDIADNATYSKLEMPVLGIGGSGYAMLNHALPSLGSNVKVKELTGGGHFIAEEKPKETAQMILGFLEE